MTDPQERDTWNQQFEQDMHRVETLRGSNEVGDYEQFAAELERRWSDRPGQEYSELMRRLCEILVSYEVNGIKGRDLAEQYAMATLEKGAEMSVVTELRLALCLQVPRTPGHDEMWQEQWPRDRRVKAQRWMAAWKRLEQKIEPDFDFDRAPSMKVAPPAETGLPAGVSPSAIEDPRLRAEYEEAISKNMEELRRFNTQYHIRQVERQFRRGIEDRMIRAYSILPFDDEELRRLVQENVRDQKMIERILEAVQAEKPAAEATRNGKGVTTEFPKEE